jgi:hypothetical protein
MIILCTYHFYVHLARIQQVSGRIYDYIMHLSFWFASCRDATSIWQNIWLCCGPVTLVCILQGCNKYLTEYSKVYNYIMNLSFWYASYKDTTIIWQDIWLYHGLVILMHILYELTNKTHYDMSRLELYIIILAWPSKPTWYDQTQLVIKTHYCMSHYSLRYSYHVITYIWKKICSCWRNITVMYILGADNIVKTGLSICCNWMAANHHISNRLTMHCDIF